MWFKNLIIFELADKFNLTSDEIESKLSDFAFKPCSPHQLVSFGWDSVISGIDTLSFYSNDCLLLCAKQEKKLLPASVVKDLLKKEVFESESKLGRRLSKKERSTLKDEIIFSALPKAFTQSKQIIGYIDFKLGYLIVDSASFSVADSFVSLLRETLGSFPCQPLAVNESPSVYLSKWLAMSVLESKKGFVIEHECELVVAESEGGVMRCKNYDLNSPELTKYAENKLIKAMGFSYEERLSFVLLSNFVIKRLRFLDLIKSQLDENYDSPAFELDAEFHIMSGELREFIPRLTNLFGGVQCSV